jgi:hypothetical protein
MVVLLRKKAKIRDDWSLAGGARDGFVFAGVVSVEFSGDEKVPFVRAVLATDDVGTTRPEVLGEEWAIFFHGVLLGVLLEPQNTTKFHRVE